MDFASDEKVAVGEGGESFVNNVDGGVFAAAAESGEREEGDAGRCREELGSGSVGLFNNFGELSGSGMLARGHVSEEIKFGVAAHDGKARKSMIRLVGKRVVSHFKMVAASENNITSGMRDTCNHGVGGARFDHLAGGGEIRSRESGDFGPRTAKMI